MEGQLGFYDIWYIIHTPHWMAMFLPLSSALQHRCWRKGRVPLTDNEDEFTTPHNFAPSSGAALVNFIHSRLYCYVVPYPRACVQRRYEISYSRYSSCIRLDQPLHTLHVPSLLSLFPSDPLTPDWNDITQATS